MESKGKGKRGGARVIYVDIEVKETVYFINVYTKNEKDDMPAPTFVASEMEKELIQEVVNLSQRLIVNLQYFSF